MSHVDRAGYRPPSALSPSRGDAAGPQPATLTTPSPQPTPWPSSGPALTGAGTPGQAETKALLPSGGMLDGKSISSLQAGLGTPSAAAVAGLHRALAELVGLVPQDGKQASRKHHKQFEEKLEAFAALATTSRDAALHIVVKSFEMLAAHRDPRWVDWVSPHQESVFEALAERVFLALDVGGDIANLRAALAAIPGGDVLAASPAKAALPEQMMRALTRAVGAITPERPWTRFTVPQGHIDALLARVSVGSASEKTAQWLRGMTHGLFVGVTSVKSNFKGEVYSQLLPWAQETLRTLSGEQIAGMACGVLEALGTTRWTSYESLLTELTAPQKGAFGAAAGKYWLLARHAPSVYLAELAPLIERLDPLGRTAFVCGMASQLPPERRNALVEGYEDRYPFTNQTGGPTQRAPELLAAFRLAVTLAGDPFAEFDHAVGDAAGIERLEAVLQIPGVARDEHARRLAELVDRGVIPRARAEALAARLGPAFSSELLRALLDAAGQALRQRIADTLATLAIPAAEPMTQAQAEQLALQQAEAALPLLDDAANAYAEQAGLIAYVGSRVQRSAFTAPPISRQALALHLATLQGLVKSFEAAEGKTNGSRLDRRLRQVVATRLSNYIAALHLLPEAQGLGPLEPVSFAQGPTVTQPQHDVKASGPGPLTPQPVRSSSQDAGAVKPPAGRSSVRSLDDDEI